MANKRKCKLKECGIFSRGGMIINAGYFCDMEHAIKFARANAGKAREKAIATKRKEFNRDIRAEKQRIKSRGEWLKEAQTAFNSYIRARDDSLPCISCNRHHTGQYHAGHYRTVGAHPELRFDERNCHKQCAPCNNHKSGNIVEYRINLLGRLGVDTLDALEGPHAPKKYTIDDIKAIKAEYKQKLKEIEK